MTIDFGEDGSQCTGKIVENTGEKDLDVFWGNVWKGLVIQYRATEGVVLEKDIIFIGTFELSKDSLVLTSLDKETILEFEPAKQISNCLFANIILYKISWCGVL